MTPAQRLELADVMCRDASLLRAAGRETLRSLSKARNARPRQTPCRARKVLRELRTLDSPLK